MNKENVLSRRNLIPTTFSEEVVFNLSKSIIGTAEGIKHRLVSYK